MEEPPSGPMVAGCVPEPGQNTAGEGGGLCTSYPVFFSIIFSLQRAALHPSLEVQAIKEPAKSKQKEIGKGDRSPDSYVSLVGLGRGSEVSLVGTRGRSVEDVGLWGRGASV